MRLLKFLSSLCMVLVLAATASANPIVSGAGASLTVDSVNPGAGAIGTFSFGGSDFFNPGSPVSDFGFQLGASTATFGAVRTTDSNTANINVTSVTSLAGVVSVVGTYTGGGANVAFTRTYDFVGGQNVLRISTTVTNNGAGALADFRVFDSFDPDQGVDQGDGFGTFNDRLGLAGITVAQASSSSNGASNGTPQLTSIIGSTDPLAIVSAGLLPGGSINNFPFQIFDGTDVNAFFTSPRDDNGAFSDFGSHIGRSFNLGAGQSGNFTFDLAVGLTPADAQAAFLAVNTPEPASLALWSMFGAAGLAAYRRRRAKMTA